jgi:hypothetical protein
MPRKNIVIVRAGNSSLHPGWLAGEGDRSWDLIVNYYGDDPDRYKEDDVTRIDSKGPKWPALSNLITEHLDTISGYERIWLPDDDLKTDKASVNALFALCERYDLEVAQPSLTWDSYFGHLTTLQNRDFVLRYTNYVEVMAPCLTREMLLRSLPLFNSNLSGWGLDFVWAALADRAERGIAIIDAVTVRHTRPVGGPNYAALRASGISPWDELRSFCRAHGIDEAPIIATHGAIRANGTAMQSGGNPRLFSLSLIKGLIPAVRQSPERQRMVRRMAGMAYKAICNIPDRVSEAPMVKLPQFRRKAI